MLQFIYGCGRDHKCKLWFQYISCCSLSLRVKETYSSTYVSIHLMLQFIGKERQHHLGQIKFQYISCCSLSIMKLHSEGTGCVSIHLMLQFILSARPLLSSNSQVSIHLMLQFIEILQWRDKFQTVFQYISCCSLSDMPGHSQHHNSAVSIHLMLQFIEEKKSKSKSYQHVSIHLMLQFIKKCTELQKPNVTSFNTSHVVVYHIGVKSPIQW